MNAKATLFRRMLAVTIGLHTLGYSIELSLADDRSANVSESNWPQFRGSDSTGVSTNSGQPDRWNAAEGAMENVAWKVATPGRGWGSPVVWGNRVFLTTVVPSEAMEPVKKGLYFGGDRPKVPTATFVWKVICLDLETGKELWAKTLREGPATSPIHLKNSYASETPLTDGTHVYVCFGNVGMYCLDTDGNIVWSNDLPSRPTRYGWGTAASPVLYDDAIYYVSDNDEASTITKIDKNTGKVIWKKERDEKSNWSTPFVWKHDKGVEIVTAGTNAVRSYDLDGNLLWSLKGMSSITIATPYAADGLLYVSSGYVLDPVKAMYAIKPGARGDITLAENESSNEFIVWSSMKIAPYNPSTLVHNGRLYVLYDRGTLSCYDAKTGKPLYENQRLKRGSSFTASPWYSRGKIFCLDEDGQCAVIPEGDRFEILHTNPLASDDVCLSTPAMVGDRLLLRTETHLYCIKNR